MRTRARCDRNQVEIVSAFRRLGCTVQHLHTVGKGCPDILIGMKNRNYLVEIKDGALPPSARKLTSDESKWHNEWSGQVTIIETVEDVVRFVDEQP